MASSNDTLSQASFVVGQVSEQLRLTMRRLAFGAQRREETWRLLADLTASGMSLSQALLTAADAARGSGRTSVSEILLDIEAGVARAQVQARVKKYAQGAESLVFGAIGKVEAEGVFRAAARLAAQQNKMSSALRQALAMPAVLTFMLGVITYILGAYLFPAVSSISSPAGWPWYVTLTAGVTEFLVANAIWIGLPLGALVALIIASLPVWTGKGRLIADRFVPFSLYKLQQGTAFIFTVIELGRMGQTLAPPLLEGMAREASPYLRSRILAIRDELSSQTWGKALQAAGHEFPSRDLITVCAALDGTDGWIERFAGFLDRWLELLEQRIKERVQVVNVCLMILMAAVLGGVALSMAPLMTLAN